MQHFSDAHRPDVRKPVATVALHDLLVLGYRLGLDWTDVDPRGEKLTAQDDFGNDISAFRIMGLGLAVQFRHTVKQNPLELSLSDSNTSAQKFPHELMVPNFQADKLAFGVIPGDSRLGFDDIILASEEDCLAYVATLDKDLRETLQNNLKNHRSRTGIDQIMPLISPCLLLHSCKTTNVRRPNEWCHQGVLFVMEGYVMYRNTIQEWITKESTSKSRRNTIKWIQDHWSFLKEKLRKPFVWAAFIDQTDPAMRSKLTVRVHAQCTTKLNEMTDTFYQKLNQGLEKSNEADNQKYHPLRNSKRLMQVMLRFHMRRALRLRERAEALSEEKKVRVPGDVRFPQAQVWCDSKSPSLFSFSEHSLVVSELILMIAVMAIHMREVDVLAKDVIQHVVTNEALDLEHKQGKVFEELVEILGNIWLVWIFRALVFNRSCSFVTPRRAGGGKQYSMIPAEWLDSTLPVHIT